MSEHRPIWHQDDFQTKEKTDDPVHGKTPERPVKSQEKSRKNQRAILILFLIFVVLLLLSNSLYRVPEGEMAIVSQFGKIVNIEENAGLHLRLPFIQNVSYLTSKIQFYNVSPSEVLTADKKAMIVDSYALWRIEDATRFIRSVGNITETEKRIDASVYSNIKNIMGRLQQNEIISDEEGTRESLNDQVTARADKELQNYGIKMLRVEIRRYDLPKDNLDAVYKRMISERQQMAAAIKAEGEYEAAKIRNEADKEVEIRVGEAEAAAKKIDGEAEQEYMDIMKDFFKDPDRADFYRFMISLDSFREALSGDKTIILGKDSPLGKFLNGESY